MDAFNKILQLASGESVELADSFKELLHTKLILGQTRYVCRYGTLSDGHDKLTSAQRYYQAYKEIWARGQNIKGQRVVAKRAQAKLIRAKTAYEEATCTSEILLAEADMEEAETTLLQSLVTIEDQLREVDEFNKVRLELMPEVEAKYPGGIEESERDSWMALGEYKAIKQDRLENVPLDPLSKARLGERYGRIEAILPLMFSEKETLKQIPESETQIKEFIEAVENSVMQCEGK